VPVKPVPKSLGPYVQAGDAVIGAAVLTVAGAAGGHWLDRQLHTAPLFTMLLLFGGMFAGLWRMIAKVSGRNSGSARARPPAAPGAAEPDSSRQAGDADAADED